MNLTHRLIITEWLTLAGIFLGCFFFLHSEIRSLEAKQDSRLMAQEQRVDQMNMRTDQLYQMFVDLLKERK